MIDKRIQKTKRDLKNGLLELMKERPLEKISVSEICEYAVINRVTFYSHYVDKYALYNELLEDIIENITIKTFDKFNDLKNREELMDACSLLIEYIINECESKKQILLSFSQEENSMALFILSGKINKHIKELFNFIKEKGNYPTDFISTFICGGISSNVQSWLSSNEIDKATFISLNQKLIKDLFSSNII